MVLRRYLQRRREITENRERMSQERKELFRLICPDKADKGYREGQEYQNSFGRWCELGEEIEKIRAEGRLRTLYNVIFV